MCRNQALADPERYLHSGLACALVLKPHTVPPGEYPYYDLDPVLRRFWVGVVFSLPLLALVAGEAIFGRHPWLEWMLASPVVIWSGWPFFQRAAAALIHLHFNLFMLIALATAAIYLYSVVALIMPDWLPSTFRYHSNNLRFYFAPAAVMVTLVLFVQAVELRAYHPVSKVIQPLFGLSPEKARFIQRVSQACLRRWN